MAYLYAYAPTEENCATIGLVGAMMPSVCKFSISAGEFGELEIEHPYDEYGKWLAFAENVILKTDVPVRLCPEINNGAYVETVEKWQVANTATKAQRYIYSKATKGRKKKLLNAGTVVTVTSKGDERYKVVTGKYSGWMDYAGLTNTQETITIPATSAGIEQAQESYAIRSQLFRVYSIDPTDECIKVRARQGANCADRKAQPQRGPIGALLPPAIISFRSGAQPKASPREKGGLRPTGRAGGKRAGAPKRQVSRVGSFSPPSPRFDALPCRRSALAWLSGSRIVTLL